MTPPTLRHSRARLARLATLVALVAVAACDSVTAPPAGITGRWRSTDGRTTGPTGAAMTLVLEQRGAAVTGSGSYDEESRIVALDVDGSISDRVVVLTLSPEPGPDAPDALLLQGMLSDDGARLTSAITLGEATATRVFVRQ